MNPDNLIFFVLGIVLGIMLGMEITYLVRVFATKTVDKFLEWWHKKLLTKVEFKEKK